MSSAIGDSFAKSVNSFAKIANLHSHREHSHSAKFGILDYLLTQPAKSNIPSTALTSGTTIDFELKSYPSLYLKDSDSIWLLWKCQETGGVSTVEPTFAEAFLDKNNAVEVS